ncbi:MAG: DUF2818 family protein [Oxalobacteraceae bacterium]|jgi:hypothetical protein|nr:DUF2818 family protein [Oxalobacteraceae bacterium]
MNSAAASWMVIALMAFCANFPYFSESVFGFFRSKQGPKSPFIRILELLILYFLVLGVAYAIESSIGNAFAQGWQFYAVTVCLYLVLGFPGFVHRYLRRRQS